MPTRALTLTRTSPHGRVGAKPKKASGVANSGELAAKRTDYYDKWAGKAKDLVEKADKEEEEEKKASDAALGLDSAPRSKAEAEDRAKHAALKEAKKAWEEKRKLEEDLKFYLDGVDGKKGSYSESERRHRLDELLFSPLLLLVLLLRGHTLLPHTPPLTLLTPPLTPLTPPPPITSAVRRLAAKQTQTQTQKTLTWT